MYVRRSAVAHDHVTVSSRQVVIHSRRVLATAPTLGVIVCECCCAYLQSNNYRFVNNLTLREGYILCKTIQCFGTQSLGLFSRTPSRVVSEVFSHAATTASSIR